VHLVIFTEKPVAALGVGPFNALSS